MVGNSPSLPDYAAFLTEWRNSSDVTLRHLSRLASRQASVLEGKVVLATGNKYKIVEHCLILCDGRGFSPQLVTQYELGIPDTAETCNTLVGNATLKAYVAAKHTGLPALGDDTGIFIDALGGEPGVYTARYAGESSSTQDVKDKILFLMKDKKQRTATFRTVAALADPHGPLGDNVLWIQPESRGVIIEQEVPSNPFFASWGLDPIFAPYDLGQDQDNRLRTLADVPQEQKLTVSHRAKAFTAMRYCLATYMSSKGRL